MATSNKPHIPLSKLRDMWGMAKRSYATYDPDTRDRFQSLVADEVQRRRVKALEAERCDWWKAEFLRRKEQAHE